jgi:hypothetical protein
LSSKTVLSSDVFNLPGGFEACCLEVFRYQSEANPIYKAFIEGLHILPEEIREIEKIPFLPVGLFKNHRIVSGEQDTEIVFSSSGTSGMQTSKHYVTDLQIYIESFRRGFAHFYGDIAGYCVLALLPSYLEREGSSLIVMAEDMIAESKHPQSAFYLHNPDALHRTLWELEKSGQKTLLLGVTYALLDFAETWPMQLNHTIVMETGGMKGKRKELVRQELHAILCGQLGVKSIHSEYGMTELLSQAYSKGEGIFMCPPWMRVLTRETNDPLSLTKPGAGGGINIIDLANVNSCSFIATQDLGKIHAEGSFEILGRFDNSDLRGCNLMVE